MAEFAIHVHPRKNVSPDDCKDNPNRMDIYFRVKFCRSLHNVKSSPSVNDKFLASRLKLAFGGIWPSCPRYIRGVQNQDVCYICIKLEKPL